MLAVFSFGQRVSVVDAFLCRDDAFVFRDGLSLCSARGYPCGKNHSTGNISCFVCLAARVHYDETFYLFSLCCGGSEGIARACRVGGGGGGGWNLDVCRSPSGLWCSCLFFP